MSRPRGSKNKRPATTKTIAVRLSDDEQRVLAEIHTKPSKAIHELIARHGAGEKGKG